ncbi:DUF1127 domain-containing protein [Labrys sp. KNU-23]|uniref:DUF1127 domain-containing protein n=1 Tax=Labrys sp. KNU-23 TaxID=2789216 RepID=UPI00165BF825|nr:DUF1127 domain-containing protein [Labrys sp. KNU-23]
MPTALHGHTFHRCIGSVLAAVKRRSAIARTMRAFHRLPDSALHDIGVYRLEIDGVAAFKQINDPI